MTAPLAVQLYSVRDALQEDFEGTIRRIAQIGYAGVETNNGPYMTEQADQSLRLFRELGLQVPSMHTDLPLGDAKQRVIETALSFGATYVVCPWRDPEGFQSPDALAKFCDQMNESAEVLRPHGLKIAYHNHWFEAYPLPDGRYGLQAMLEQVDPAVLFELDAYWIKTGGQDPIAVQEKFGARIALLHVKDGPAEMEKAMTAVGEGVLDYKRIIPASRAEWLIVELDRCDTDMLTAIGQSYAYLTREGLGHGR